MTQVRHTGDIQRGYRGLMEDSGMTEEKKDRPAVALVIANSLSREIVIKKLLLEDFPRVRVAHSAEEGIWMARRIAAGGERVGFILFDSSVSKNEVNSFLAFVRGRGNLPRVPVLVMTEERDPEERVRTLESGADEVLALPCPDRETQARIRALLRRERSGNHEDPDAPARYEVGELIVDTERHEVRWKRQRIPVTPLEFRILVRLIRHPGRVMGREELMKSLWGEHWEVEDHNLSVHIHGLRKKMSRHDDPCTVIETVRGVGYRIRDEVS